MRADRPRRLAIREVLAKLQDGHQRETPRRQARVAPRGEQGGKVLILKDRAQGITERQIRRAFGKGSMGNTGGCFRDRLDDVWVERHARRPFAE
jgi:hypothetical protein